MRTFTLRNTGNTTATGVYAQVTGTNVTLTVNSCGTSASPATLAADATCSVTATYAPSSTGTLTSSSLSTYGSFATSPSTVNLTGTAVAPVDASYASVPFRATFDSSTAAEKGSAVSTSSNVSVNTAGGKFGGSLDLATTSSKLTYAANTGYSLTGDYTIEGWARVSTMPSNGYIFDVGSNGLTLQIMSSGTYFRVGSGGGVAFDTPTGSYISTNTWFHWALVRSGTAVKLYVNGNNIGSGTFNGTMGGNTPFTLGNYGGGGNYSWLGSIDDVRITNGVARYTGNFTPVQSAMPTQ